MLFNIWPMFHQSTFRLYIKCKTGNTQKYFESALSGNFLSDKWSTTAFIYHKSFQQLTKQINRFAVESLFHRFKNPRSSTNLMLSRNILSNQTPKVSERTTDDFDHRNCYKEQEKETSARVTSEKRDYTVHKKI